MSEQMEYCQVSIDNTDFYNDTSIFFKEHLNKDLFFFGILDNDEIVSTCALQFIQYPPAMNENSKIAYIFNVFTKQDYRNKGLATVILKEVIKFCINQKIDRIKLSTNNLVAKNIYKKLGFKESKTAMSLVLKKETINL